MKARQQKELADAVIAKIDKDLENPKVLDQILKQAVADVESTFEALLHRFPSVKANSTYRNRAAEAVIGVTVT